MTMKNELAGPALFGRRTLCLQMLGALAIPAWSASKPISDDFLIDSIRSRLAADQIVKGGAIDVEAKDAGHKVAGLADDPGIFMASRVAQNIFRLSVRIPTTALHRCRRRSSEHIQAPKITSASPNLKGYSSQTPSYVAD